MPQYPHKKNVITSRFGYYNPFGTPKMHYAHDYGNNGLPPSSMPTGASITGAVIDAGYDSARGNYVIIRGIWSEKSDAITENYHLNSISVKKGQAVYEGDTIGYQGNTGSSTAQHTHVGFYLVPKSYVYSKNGIINKRNDYALDPVAFFRKTSEQIVDMNGKYTYKPIPKPEPKPKDLTQITNGRFTMVTNVEVFYMPFNEYSPIIGGDNRSKKYLGHFFPNVKTYVAQYVCHTPDAVSGAEIEWAGILTDWGLLWAPVIEGRSTLTYDGKEPVTPSPEPEEEEEKPLSKTPIKLKIGYASAGDIKSIKALLDSLIIGYTEDKGYLYTTVAVSAGDQVKILGFCEELGVPCVEYAEIAPEDEDKDAKIAQLEAQLDAANARIKKLEADKEVLRNRVELRDKEIAEMKIDIKKAVDILNTMV